MTPNSGHPRRRMRTASPIDPIPPRQIECVRAVLAYSHEVAMSEQVKPESRAVFEVAYDRWRERLMDEDWQGRPIAPASAESLFQELMPLLVKFTPAIT